MFQLFAIFSCKIFSFYHDFEFSIFIFLIFSELWFIVCVLRSVDLVFLLCVCVCYIA